MATKNATPAPAAKKAAAPAKTAAPAKKVAAPAPAPEPADEVAVDVGTKIKFLGYGADVPPEQQFLVADEVYEVAGITEAEGDDPGGDPYVMIANPDFNAKKKESDDNPKELAVSVLPDEYEVAGDEEEEAEEVAAPAPAAKKTAAKAAAPAPAAKTATKAVGKAKAAPAPEPEAEAEEAEDADALPDLEGEDEEVLALVNGERDLVEVAQELETAAAVSEYRLGGILYHIKKDKSYVQYGDAEQGVDYSEKGGFATFLKDYFNVEYRKAMYLIDIYVAFTLAGIEAPAEKVAAMGWAKASKIARPMMAEGAKVEDLVELAETNTLADLSTAIKEQVNVGGTGSTGGNKVTRTTLKFRLLEQEGATAVGILDAVKEAQSLKDIGEALMFILNDWASTNAPQAAAKSAPAAKKAVGKPAAKKATAKA